MKTAGVNEARYDNDPLTGASLGMLLEVAATNLLNYSEQFDHASWVSTGGASVL